MAGRNKMTKQEKLKKISANPELWLKNFVKINSPDGEYVPFVLNDEQKHVLDNIDRYNIIGKSRQIGMTSLSCGLMLYYAHNFAKTTYLILAHNQEATQNIFERIKDMYLSIPDEYRIGEKRNNRMELMLENDSKIVVKTASNNGKGLGRSYTCKMILCSEFAFWSDDQQKNGLLALEQAMLKKDSYLIIESTSNGYNYYQKLITDASKGRSKFKCFFFNWYQNRKMFKSEYKTASDWFYSQNGSDKLRERDLENDELELYKKGATLYQLEWRRWKLTSMELHQYFQEYPSTIAESFISTHKGIFDINKILERLKNIYPPLKKNQLYKEIPVQLEDYLGKSLFLYMLPVVGKRYYAGVDVASGVGADYSAISIIDSDGQQVCVFNNNKIPIYKFAEIVNILGRYYNYAFTVIERNNVGIALIERIRRDCQYLNLYKHKTFDDRGKKKLELGWITTGVTKAKLLMDLKEEFEKGLILINDQDTLEQMKIYIQNEKGKMGNIEGKDLHDDLVIATGLAVQGIRARKWYV